MSSENQRDLYKGLDDGWTRAIELVVTPGVAAGIGYLIDRAAGIFPALTIAFLVLAVAGTFVKLCYSYDLKMRALDAESPWGRQAGQAEPGTERS